MPDVFAAVDWYDPPVGYVWPDGVESGRIAVIPRPSDFDPTSLVGQLATINGVSYLVRDTLETVNPLTVGLLVSQPGLPGAG